MPKSLVLGANGFIGSHLVDRLIEEGHKVRAFGRFRDGSVGFKNHRNIEIFTGDFLNTYDLEKAVEGCDYVFHLISTTTPATAENDPFIDLDTNVRQTVELLRHCVNAKVRRVIYASSGGTVYGASHNETNHKETDSTRPISPYGIGKVAIEDYLRYFNVKHQLDYTVFRIANPYGERQQFWRKQGVVPIFIKRVLDGQPLDVYGDGSMIRDYIYVKDLVDMMVVTLRKTPEHDTYNIGSGKGYSVNQIIEAIENVTGLEIRRNTLSVPPTFVDKTVLDSTRYEREFDVSPHTSLEEGIRATFAYIQEGKKRES